MLELHCDLGNHKNEVMKKWEDERMLDKKEGNSAHKYYPPRLKPILGAMASAGEVPPVRKMPKLFPHGSSHCFGPLPIDPARHFYGHGRYLALRPIEDVVVLRQASQRRPSGLNRGLGKLTMVNLDVASLSAWSRK